MPAEESRRFTSFNVNPALVSGIALLLGAAALGLALALPETFGPLATGVGRMCAATAIGVLFGLAALVLGLRKKRGRIVAAVLLLINLGLCAESLSVLRWAGVVIRFEGLRPVFSQSSRGVSNAECKMQVCSARSEFREPLRGSAALGWRIGADPDRRVTVRGT